MGNVNPWVQAGGAASEVGHSEPGAGDRLCVALSRLTSRLQLEAVVVSFCSRHATVRDEL